MQRTTDRKRPLSSSQTFALSVVACLAAALLLSCLPAGALSAQKTAGKTGKALQIVRITPAGEEVPMGRQIVLEFDRPVVPLGRMERDAAELPISIEPRLNCQWRWQGTSTLACNLDEQDAFRPATEYRLTISAGIMTEDKSALAKTVRHAFTTERPKITDSWFKTWLSPRMPLTSVRCNLAMDKDSLAAHLFYRAAGGRRISAKVEEDPDYERSPEQKDNRMWLVSPLTELPTDAPVELVVEPGLVSSQGPVKGVENRVIGTLQAIPEFRFLGLSCTDRANQPFRIAPGQPPSEQQSCLPSGGVSLLFSAPILAEELKEGLQLNPALRQTAPDADPWEQIYSYSQLGESYTSGKEYSIYLPESLLKAHTAYRLGFAASSLKDEFGRTLTDPVDMRFTTDHRAPDYALLKNMPVLEKGLDTDAHLWSVNLDQINLNYQRVKADGTRTAGSDRILPAGPGDVSIPVPLGIRKLVGSPSGLVQGHLTTQPEVPGKSAGESWFFAQVTPFQVHLKLGHHNSMVWITDLSTGKPVSGVTVEVVKSTFKNFGDVAGALATATTGEDGVAEMAGTAAFDPELKHVWADGADEPGLFLRCRKDADLAVLPVRYEYQVASEGANREYIPDWLRPLYGHIHVWGATAQGIYKAGDTMQYKIYVRDQNNLRFTRPPGVGREVSGKAAVAAGKKSLDAPEEIGTGGGKTVSRKSAEPRYRLKVEDPMGKIIHDQDGLSLSDFGALHGEVAVPKNGAVGWYRFILSADFSKNEWEPMRVLVSDFTPSPFRVSTDLNGKSFATGDTVEIVSEAKLHAGGPYTGAAASVTASLAVQPFVPDNPQTKGFEFAVAELADGGMPEVQTLYETQGNLDDKGVIASSFNIAETSVWYGKLTVESSVQDDRGKSIANRISAPCFGRDRFVGILQQDWTLQQGREAEVQLVVVDRDGRIVPGVPVTVKTEYEKTMGARVKGAGDEYLTEYEHTWEIEQELNGVSGDGPLKLAFTPAHAGSLRLTAVIEDSQGRSHSTAIGRWVTGRGVVLWESIPGNLLNVYPEKNSYNVGETARFLVQNPFPGAHALITVERFGVIQRWSKVFHNSSEIVEIPVLPDYLPGFYVSVMVTSPRVEKPPGPQGEDLGKPAYRMGYVKIPVKDPYKELVVDITPEKEVYKPRDTVRLDLRVKPRNPAAGEASQPIELAVAVLDEAVFDLLLKGRKAYDPYEGLYSLDELDLSNYNLLMQLVGREKLAIKGANAGGSGGPDLSMRSLFKFVSYWNPSLLPDADGKASVEFEVPDNLTGWRVLAMAVTPEDRMGLGEAVFKVNQSTEIRPALPNQVLENDRFDAGFTLMNRTETPRTLEVTLTTEGPVREADGQQADGKTAGLTRKITIEPFKRETLRFPLQATGSGEIVLMLTAGDGIDLDGFRQTLPVSRRQVQETSASYGMTTGGTSENIHFPENMREDSGSLALELSPTVIGGLEGAFAYLRDYRFSCWEQKLTRGLMAAMYVPLESHMPAGFVWPDSGKAVQEALDLAVEHQAPGGGMTYYVPKDEYVSPYLSAFTALAFNRMRQLGARPPEHVERRLQEYLLNLLRHDAVPEGYSKGMTATVRAVALAALAGNGRIKLADVERFRSHLPHMSLFGKALYLQALLATGGSRTEQRQVLDGILAHANQGAGSMVFGESLDTGYQALLCSPVRDNAAILSGLLAWLKANPADSVIQEMPVRLMRSLVLSRKGRDHWAGTQENLFVVMALMDYARLYEEKKPDMVVAGRLDRESLGSAAFKNFTDPPVVLARPVKSGDAGRKAVVTLEKKGEGRLYYAARLSYSPAQLRSDAVNAGIEVFREYSAQRDGKWRVLQNPIELKTGEVVRVDLYVSLPAERYFVVLEDPVPGGLEPVNRDLATASLKDAGAGEEEYPAGSYRHTLTGWLEDVLGRWSFYHRELRHDAVRFYSERLAAGRYHLSYTAQAISAGDFQILPAHAEEMYTPDVFGQGMPGRLRIEASR